MSIRINQDDQKPINMAGVQFNEVLAISVNEWHPQPDGGGKPEQLHLVLEVAGLPHPLVVRFKSPRPVDSLIVALMTHRKGVWPVNP